MKNHVRESLDDLHDLLRTAKSQLSRGPKGGFGRKSDVRKLMGYVSAAGAIANALHETHGIAYNRKRALGIVEENAREAWQYLMLAYASQYTNGHPDTNPHEIVANAIDKALEVVEDERGNRRP